MQTHILGYPRIGSRREQKKANEQFWAGKIIAQELLAVGENIRKENWKIQKEAGLDVVTCNDFSWYDQVLDMSLTLGAIPERYKTIAESKSELELYYAMARGFQKEGWDITAMEMTKWLDTNYHYLVPEFTKNQQFSFYSQRIIENFKEAKENNPGKNVKPAILGLVSYLLLGKEKENSFDRLDLASSILLIYEEILTELQAQGSEFIQWDEPCLCLDLSPKAKETYQKVYQSLREKFPKLQFILATYFGGLKDNLPLAATLPIDILHIDLARNPEQPEEVLAALPKEKKLSLGLVDGRNIWKNNFEKSLAFINQAVEHLGVDRVWIATSCSLLHSPCDLDLETKLNPEIRQWLAFAKQKVTEVATLKKLALSSDLQNEDELKQNIATFKARETSLLIHDEAVKARLANITADDSKRKNNFAVRQKAQQELLKLPLFPTTTIGSFPQTPEVRKYRSQYKKNEIIEEQYTEWLKNEIKESILWQEETDIDVLVHGEFERNDMVEYFGEQLKGFVFSQNGWVQSYGSRCVKPPIIFGDVSRPQPMTVFWSQYAQSLTSKWVKGMLTGPVTILQWSFVRDDQPRSTTCKQIALAIRDEVADLEKAGIKIIQIDEPAIREGLPLRKSAWQEYLEWAIEAFRISASLVEDSTQIHTHMCYSEFNDIIQNIADMDADVITIECSRSQMELLNAFSDFKYPNEIGPGVYDIHSPRIPSESEMIDLLKKACKVLPKEQLWINPDCGLKTRNWEETKKALLAMVATAKEARRIFADVKEVKFS